MIRRLLYELSREPRSQPDVAFFLKGCDYRVGGCGCDSVSPIKPWTLLHNYRIDGNSGHNCNPNIHVCGYNI